MADAEHEVQRNQEQQQQETVEVTATEADKPAEETKKTDKEVETEDVNEDESDQQPKDSTDRIKKRDRPSTPRAGEEASSDVPKLAEAPPALKRNRLQNAERGDKDHPDNDKDKDNNQSPSPQASQEEDLGERSADDEKVSKKESSKVTAVRQQVADMTTQDGAESTKSSKEAPSSTPTTTLQYPSTTKQPTFASFSSVASPFASVPTTSNISLSSQTSTARFPLSLGGTITPTPPSPSSSLRAQAGSVPPSVPGSVSSATTSLHATPEPDAQNDNKADPSQDTIKQKQSTFATFSAKTSPFASIHRNSSGDNSHFHDSLSSSNNDPKGKRPFGIAAKDADGFPGDRKKESPKQKIFTGEEEDTVLQSVKGKLYMFEDGDWREKGAGLLKLLTRQGDKGPITRLTMRTDATYRLILNTLLFNGQNVEHPSNRQVRFSAIDDSKVRTFAVNIRDPVAAANLVNEMKKHINELKQSSSLPDKHENNKEQV